MDPNTSAQVSDTPSALATPLVQAASVVSPSVSPVPARAKETGVNTTAEVSAYVEVVGSDSIEKEPLPPEVSSWMEKVSRDNTGEMPTEIVIADTQSVNSQTASQKSSVFVLPLGKTEIEVARQQSVQSSVRWLAEWCARLVKKLGDQVTFG